MQHGAEGAATCLPEGKAVEAWRRAEAEEFLRMWHQIEQEDEEQAEVPSLEVVAELAIGQVVEGEEQPGESSGGAIDTLSRADMHDEEQI